MRDIEKYTNEYKKAGFEDILVEYRRKKILSIIDNYIPRKILEIGCGLHPLFEFYQDFDKFVYFEPSKELFMNAEKTRNNNSRIIGFNLPFSVIDEIKEYHPDFIICSSLLHELENPDEMLSDIHKISVPETIIHINVPNANSFHRILAKSMHLINNTKEMSERNILLQQNQVFDMESLISMIHNNGFEVIESGSYFIKPFTHEQMWKMIKMEIINNIVLDGLYNMGQLLPDMGAEIFVDCVLYR